MTKQKIKARECCIDSTVSCKCESDEKCIEILKRYAKVVYCNDDKCLFNVSLPYDYFVNRGRNHKPFKDDSFHGVCGRVDIGLRMKEIKEDEQMFNKTKEVLQILENFKNEKN